MKKVKNLTGLALALVMSISCLTMPAMAASDEIMRKPVPPECPFCGQVMTERTYSSGVVYFQCTNPNCIDFGC